jgi:hypothetical protein
MNFDTYIAQFAQKVKETEEEFIFQTIAPYCSTITEAKITKQYLIDALTQYNRLEEQVEALRAKNTYLYHENAELRAKLAKISHIAESR